MAIIIIISLILFFFLIALVSYYLEKKRTEKIKNVSCDIGFEFIENSNISTLLMQFNLLHQYKYDSWKYANLIKGEIQNIQIRIFDFGYTTGIGKYAAYHPQTIFLLEDTSLNLPCFILQPQRYNNKILDKKTNQYISLEHHLLFSNEYFPEDNGYIQTINWFNEDIMNFLATKKELAIESKNTYLLIYRPDKLVQPKEMENFIKEAFNVRDILVKNFELLKSSVKP